jgi:two-component system sensor histidine kinase UhpB
VFGIVWILTTDWLLLQITNENPSILPFVMRIKGIVFITLSAILLYTINKVDNRTLNRKIEENRGLAKRYEALRSASKEAIYEYDLKSDTIQTNSFLREIFGLTTEVMQDGWKIWQDKVHPADYERIKTGMTNQLQSGETTWQDEYQLLDAQEKYRTVIHTCYVIKDDHNRPFRVMGTILDISELKNLQKKYYRQEMLNKSVTMKAIVKAQEDERNRWAIELHDNIGQLLAVTKLYLCNFSENKAPEKEMLDRTKDIVQLSLSEIRQLSARLKTPVFEEQSLATAVQNLAGNINRVKDIHFEIKVDTIESLLQEEHKLMIYRIIQEQISNILKYADPKNVIITVEVKDNMAIVNVIDDGKGFDTTQEAVGIGLKNIRSRLKVYKGKMNISSCPGEGCSLAAEFQI